MIHIQNLEKFFGHQTLFDDVTLTLNPKEKIGLIGRNGTGKSTFLRLLLGEDSAQSGEIKIPQGFKIKALEQNLDFDKRCILDQVSASLPPGAHDQQWRAESILMGLGFKIEDFSRSPDEFSSGYQIRVRLAEALVSDSDLLLLDEPTNYLDILSLRWLERFLKTWKGSFILVTHDRHFMEQVVTHSLIIHRGKMRKMKGGPQKLMQQISLEEKVYEKTRQNAIKKKERTQEFIRNFRAGARSAGLVQSRIKSLAKQEIGTKLAKLPQIRFNFRSEPFKSNTMLQAESLEFAYDSDEMLIRDFSLNILPGDRIGIVGPNGKGKSTLLKLLTGRLNLGSGKLVHHNRLRIGYFGPDSKKALSPEKTILEELITLPAVTEKQVRSVCGALLFTGQHAKKTIRNLSGGEKSRVCLAKVLLYKNHLLALDEPTNHLDMESCQALTNSLKTFAGAVIFVTHDEAMLSEVANRLIVFDDGEITLYEKSYDEFLSVPGWMSEEEQSFKKLGKTSSNKSSYLDAKQEKKEKRKRERRLEALEKEIDSLEGQKKKNESKLQQACLDRETSQIKKLGQECKDIYDQIERLYTEMEELMELI